MVHILLVIIYLAFISLGLPDPLLGSAWPSMYQEFSVPVSYAGIVSFIIALGTVISSLNSERLIKLLGTGKLTALSVAFTAAALFGFSVSDSFWQLCVWAVPYGLGAGSVDAALNNYVAIHYSSRHMSWLHCMWGVGTIIGPYIISYGMANGFDWNFGYSAVFVLQLILVAVLIFSLPLWKNKADGSTTEFADNIKPVKLSDALKIKGAKEIMVTFFCYCGLEQTAILWASSYMVLHNGISSETAAGYASLFFIGITAGRAINGFLTVKLSDDSLIRLGQALILVGIIVMLLPLGDIITFIGLLIIGLGCAPIYPCIIHSTPEHFGAEKSQALIGIQMASAYVGTMLMPALFGLIANHISVSLFPIYLLAILLLMIVMHSLVISVTGSSPVTLRKLKK